MVVYKPFYSCDICYYQNERRQRLAHCNLATDVEHVSLRIGQEVQIYRPLGQGKKCKWSGLGPDKLSLTIGRIYYAKPEGTYLSTAYTTHRPRLHELCVELREVIYGYPVTHRAWKPEDGNNYQSLDLTHEDFLSWQTGDRAALAIAKLVDLPRISWLRKARDFMDYWMKRFGYIS